MAAEEASSSLLLRPEPLEPALDEEPPYFFRRIGEAAFDGGVVGEPNASSSALSSARARPSLASVPAAGVVAHASEARE